MRAPRYASAASRRTTSRSRFSPAGSPPRASASRKHGSRCARRRARRGRRRSCPAGSRSCSTMPRSRAFRSCRPRARKPGSRTSAGPRSSRTRASSSTACTPVARAGRSRRGRHAVRARAARARCPHGLVARWGTRRRHRARDRRPRPAARRCTHRATRRRAGQGRAHGRLRRRRWRGVAEIEKLDLTQWIESPPLGPLAGSLRFEGDLAHHAAQGVVRGAGLPAAGLRLDAKLRLADRRVHVDSLALESAPALAVRARGSMTFGDEPAYSVAADWTHCAGRSRAMRCWFRRRASHRVRLDRVHLSRERRFPAAGSADRGRSPGRFTAAAILVDASSWRVLGGSYARGIAESWRSRGMVGLRPGHRDHPRSVREGLPGRLSFEFAGSGHGFDADGPWVARVSKLSGSSGASA